MGQFTERYKAYERSIGSRAHEAALLQAALEDFETKWCEPMERLKIIPGKDALSFLNAEMQKTYKVSVTPSAIVDAMHINEIPDEMKDLVRIIARFAVVAPPN